jgi:hypothetical protein
LIILIPYVVAYFLLVDFNIDSNPIISYKHISITFLSFSMLQISPFDPLKQNPG